MSAVLASEMVFRPVRADDIYRIMQIETSAYEFPWSKGLIQDCMSEQYFFYVLILDEEIIGYAIMSCAVEEAHILNICVAPDYQGRGYGFGLLQYMLEVGVRQQAKMVFLEVRISNHKAQALYEGMGFNRLGSRRAYYPAGERREDALLYAKDLAFGVAGI